VQTLKLNGSETFSVAGLSNDIKPRQQVSLKVKRPGKSEETIPVTLRIDTPIEIDYYRHGGILPFVLREILGRS
ncbi:MAG: hypothetical protein WB586_23050, partial [Chthoniobacterales bacterium]